ncbi:MAG: protein kinase domain-containing protein, partial [Rubrobacteraceae bacterium]
MTRLGGRFTLAEEIGSGGMSVVYLGRDEVLDRPVAVKVLRTGFEDSEVGERFRREGRTAARISHPNVVQVYDAQEGMLDDREVSYIVMEHVSGGDLKDRIRASGPLSEKDLCRMGADVASGLSAAHERGIIHRDVKPQNILIDDYGRPKITDFGIARALDATTTATQTGSYLGTATYSSPEQLRGEPVTPKSDIYSLGATLYEAATGEPPFTGSPIEVAGQQLSKDPELPSARGATVSRTFEALIMAALSKEPSNRPDAATLSTKLLQEASTTVQAPSPPVNEALRKAVGGAGAAGTSGLARAAQAARKIGQSGMAATGEAARRLRLHSAGRKSGVEAPLQTVITTQNFRPGRQRFFVIAGVVALLLVLGGIALAFGFSSNESVAENPKKDAAVSDSKEPKESKDAKDLATEGSIGSGKLTEAAAVDVVAKMYLAVIQEDYKGSYASLSDELKSRDYPSQEVW